jgi:hypothetical protein
MVKRKSVSLLFCHTTYAIFYVTNAVRYLPLLFPMCVDWLTVIPNQSLNDEGNWSVKLIFPRYEISKS